MIYEHRQIINQLRELADRLENTSETDIKNVTINSKAGVRDVTSVWDMSTCYKRFARDGTVTVNIEILYYSAEYDDLRNPEFWEQKEETCTD